MRSFFITGTISVNQTQDALLEMQAYLVPGSNKMILICPG